MNILHQHYAVAGAVLALRDKFTIMDLANFAEVDVAQTTSIFNGFFEPLCEIKHGIYQLKQECRPLLEVHVRTCYVAVSARQLQEAVTALHV